MSIARRIKGGKTEPKMVGNPSAARGRKTKDKETGTMETSSNVPESSKTGNSIATTEPVNREISAPAATTSRMAGRAVLTVAVADVAVLTVAVADAAVVGVVVAADASPLGPSITSESITADFADHMQSCLKWLH
jgi:hypothetical protein